MSDTKTCVKIATGGILATTVAIVSYNSLTGDDAQSSSRFPEPTVYEFKDEDDLLCRTNFRIMGTWY